MIKLGNNETFTQLDRIKRFNVSFITDMRVKNQFK